MAENTITLYLEQDDGQVIPLEGPTDMGLSLMELLKAYEYDILATCGGMALCATCSIDIIEGEDQLSEMSDDEYAMVDTLPDPNPETRLSCQLQLSPELNGLRFKLHPVD